MMSRPSITAGLCLLLSSLTGCAEKPPAARVAAEEEARRAEEQIAMNRQMQVSYIHLGRVARSLIASELENTQAAAKALGKLRFHPATPGLARYGQLHVPASAEVEKAGDLAAAAAAAARLAMTCGKCHVAEGGDPGLGIGERPRGDPEPWLKRKDEYEHGNVHEWAVDRMWESLVTPSDAMWTAGVSGFVRDPVDEIDPNAIPDGVTFKGKFREETEEEKNEAKEKPEEPREPERQVWVDRLLEATASLAETGGPTEPTERAQMLGEILAACAGCHQLPPPEKKDDD